MIQGIVAKKLIDVILKKVMKNRELKKMRKYIEEENELDVAVKDLTNRIKTLESNSHPPKEFICCTCGNKAKKLNNKGENK
jgi:hypothetical protein